MKQIIGVVLIIIAVIAMFVVGGAFYVVNETHQAVITQFGKPIGKPVTEAGLHFKMPFIHQVNLFEKRILEWDGHPNQIPTKDKKYIWVDTTARWMIADALKFLQSVGNEVGGQARLDDIIDSTTRDFVTSHNLVEVVRNSNTIIEEVEQAEDSDAVGKAEELERIEFGREDITNHIRKEAAKITLQYGIELIDVRVKRINYVTEVQKKVFERMISERKRAAEKYRSEGQGKKAEIEGRMEKELNQIRSEAYRVAQEIKGNGDAEAVKIYADAYNKDPEFYSFLKTLETYKKTIDSDTTILLTTDSEYLEYLKNTNTGTGGL